MKDTSWTPVNDDLLDATHIAIEKLIQERDEAHDAIIEWAWANRLACDEYKQDPVNKPLFAIAKKWMKEEEP